MVNNHNYKKVWTKSSIYNYHDGTAPQISWAPEEEQLGWVDRYEIVKNIKGLDAISTKSSLTKWKKRKALETLGIAKMLCARNAPSGLDGGRAESLYIVIKVSPNHSQLERNKEMWF